MTMTSNQQMLDRLRDAVREVTGDPAASESIAGPAPVAPHLEPVGPLHPSARLAHERVLLNRSTTQTQEAPAMDMPSSPPSSPPLVDKDAVRQPSKPSPEAPKMKDAAASQWSEVRGRWARLPRKYRLASGTALVVLVGMFGLKFIVPWVWPDPDVVTIVSERAPDTTVAASTKVASPTQDKTAAGVDPLGWGPGPVSGPAKLMIGLDATGALKSAQATTVAASAQKLIRDGATACALRLGTSADARGRLSLEVSAAPAEGNVGLFDCTVPSTTSTAPKVGG